MTVDEAVAIVDRLLKPESLNNLQARIFRQAWKNKTYQDIALNSGYSDDYIRDNGAKLWQALSQTIGVKITKKNFKAIIQQHERQLTTAAIDAVQDWSGAIDVSFFCGRSEELKKLQQLIVEDRCRLIGIFGMGGIGKTSLAVKLAREIASEFDFVIWRSLRNAPPLYQLIASIIQFLSPQAIEQNLAEDIYSKVSKLIKHLQAYRCLLILDNGETILQSGIICGKYRSKFKDYKELFQCLGQTNHQSCVILTSREKPQEFSFLEGKKTPVRSLQLKGLAPENSKDICQVKGDVYGTEKEWHILSRSYSGNPLFFKIVASTILDLFDGNIRQFLQQEILSFEDIQDLSVEQLNRLSRLEKEVMYWIAIEREAISLEQLQQNSLVSIPQKKLLEAVKSLKRRSLIEQTKIGFTQQPVVREYLIDKQIEKVAREIAEQSPDLLTAHVLTESRTQEYIRQIQTHVTLQPLASKLLEKHRDFAKIEIKLKHILENSH